MSSVARKHNLPIIADEIYGRCVFTGSFSAMHLYSDDVPVISVGGLAKEFIVPGWRVGWMILHDKGTGRLTQYKAGIKSLTQIIVGMFIPSVYVDSKFLISLFFRCKFFDPSSNSSFVVSTSR